jgi:hypothetical protein
MASRIRVAWPWGNRPIGSERRYGRLPVQCVRLNASLITARSSFGAKVGPCVTHAVYRKIE